MPGLFKFREGAAPSKLYRQRQKTGEIQAGEVALWRERLEKLETLRAWCATI